MYCLTFKMGWNHPRIIRTARDTLFLLYMVCTEHPEAPPSFHWMCSQANWTPLFPNTKFLGPEVGSHLNRSLILYEHHLFSLCRLVWWVKRWSKERQPAGKQLLWAVSKEAFNGVDQMPKSTFLEPEMELNRVGDMKEHRERQGKMTMEIKVILYRSGLESVILKLSRAFLLLCQCKWEAPWEQSIPGSTSWLNFSWMPFISNYLQYL